MRQFAILTTAITLIGCSTKHPGDYKVGAASGSASADATGVESADSLWENRGDKATLQQALGKYETAYEADPSNRHLAVQLTRGYYFLGDAHESEMDAKLAHWEQSIVWGKRCIALNAEFTALLEKGDETEETATRVITTDDVPCLYWTATALGKWAKAKGLGTTLKHIGTVKAYMARVEELDASYYHAGPHRYWGAYYAAIPSFAGRDLDKSRAEFDKSIEMAPNYLATRVLLAEYWAIKMQDKAVFEENLKYVINADPTTAADVIPENKAEQAKAKALLANMSEYFAD